MQQYSGGHWRGARVSEGWIACVFARNLNDSMYDALSYVETLL